MNIADRLHIVNLLLEDTQNSVNALTIYKSDKGHYPMSWEVGALDSKSNVIKRIEVARDQLLKIKKELLGEIE